MLSDDRLPCGKILRNKEEHIERDRQYFSFRIESEMIG